MYVKEWVFGWIRLFIGQICCSNVVQMQEVVHDIAMLLTNDPVSKFTIRENVGRIYMCVFVFVVAVRCSGSVFLRLLSNALLVAHFILPKSRQNIGVNKSNAESVLSHVFLVLESLSLYTLGHT